MASGGGGRRRRKVGRSKKKKKKVRYVSLSRHLTKAVEVPQSPGSPELVEEVVAQAHEEGGCGREKQQQQQVEAFALHPEPSTLFAAAPSLTEILGDSFSSCSGAGADVESLGGASPGGSGRFSGEEEEEVLARRALRGRERWVYCGSASSPSAATTTTTTTTSSSSAASTGASSVGYAARAAPLLKLDYEEVLAAWAGRGSLYIGGATDFAAAALGSVAPKLEIDTVFVEVKLSHPAAARIAPVTSAGRAERVRRYKEKRHALLFSKRIRYEVRRLNAVRRPRSKGRFVKDEEGAAAAMAGGGELQPAS